MGSVWLGGVCSCIVAIDEERSAVGVTHDCLVPTPAGVARLSAPVSLEFGDRSLWIFDFVELDSGERVFNAAAFVTSVEEVCGAGPLLQRNADSMPTSLLALTAEERRSNRERADGRQLQLQPTGGLVHQGTGYLYYDHALVGPGLFDREHLGTGLCVLPIGAQRCNRLVRNGGSILWAPAESVLNQGGFVVDGRAYIYGCRQVAEFTAPCVVFGVPIDDIESPPAYKVLSFFAGWVDELERGSTVVNALGALTVAEAEAGIVAVVVDTFESRAYVRRAKGPDEALGRAIASFDLAVPNSLFVVGGRAHASLRRSSLEFHVSYLSDDPAEPGLHVTTFRLFGSDVGEPYQ